jgi:hypothetical protein
MYRATLVKRPCISNKRPLSLERRLLDYIECLLDCTLKLHEIMCVVAYTFNV